MVSSKMWKGGEKRLRPEPIPPGSPDDLFSLFSSHGRFFTCFVFDPILPFNFTFVDIASVCSYPDVLVFWFSYHLPS
jgi:hypothetical protein